jgi:glutamate dehydrogenase (NAD(P)+)
MNSAQFLPPELLNRTSDSLLDFEAELESAARALDLEPWVVQRIKHAEREITVNLPLVRDDGSVINITGYRIQHSRAHGPSIGPVSFSPTAQMAGLRIAAAEITLQSALLGLRLGGAAGAIVLDADKFTERELRQVVKGYVIALRENTGPLADVLVPDGEECVSGWMDETNTHVRGQSEPAAIVGRAAPRSTTAAATAALVQHTLATTTLAGVRIAIQGFGCTGRALAEAFHQSGGLIVGVADRSGGLLRDEGLDLLALEKHVAEHGVIFGFPEGQAVTNVEVLESDCDVLVLAAAERQIGSHNARRIGARVILEMTRGAIETESPLPGDSICIPHLLASAAELAVWSHEWQRGLSYSAIDPDEAESEASAVAIHALDRVRRLEESREISLRQAGVIGALERLATSLRRR